MTYNLKEIMLNHLFYVLYFDDIAKLIERSDVVNDFARKLNYAQNVADIGYFEVYLEERQFFFSSELYKILGIKNKKAKDRDIVAERIHPKDVDKLNAKVAKLLETQKKIEANFRFIKEDTGDIITCCLKADVFCDDKCKIVGTLQDLTEVVKQRKELVAAKRKAEKLSRARSYFIGQASHDLRQPIQAMRMSLYNLKKEKLSKKQNSLVDNIASSIENLSYLLDNLIDISKLDYGGEKYHPYSFNLSNLINKIVKDFEGVAKDKKIKFIVNNADIEMYSNPFFVERIIRNLLSNAFKYTKDIVSLDISIKNKDVELLVGDNGIGIKKGELKHIFDEFFQSKYAMQNDEGVGLGLPIVKKMLDLLEGKIKIKTKLGEGSNFIVNIPITKKA